METCNLWRPVFFSYFVYFVLLVISAAPFPCVATSTTILLFHFQIFATSKPEEGWYGLASRNIVLNIRRFISPPQVFDLSSFYYRNSLQMAWKKMPSFTHDMGKQNWNFLFCFLPMHAIVKAYFFILYFPKMEFELRFSTFWCRLGVLFSSLSIL